MKELLVILTFCFLGNICIAQKNESDKIYWVALQKYVSSIDTLYFKNQNQSKTIYLEKPDFIDSLPEVVNDYKIVILTSTNIRKIYKDHKNSLIHTKLFPLTIKNDSLYISIIPYLATFKMNNYNMGLSDGTTIHFKFDFDQKKYIVSRVEKWGI